MDKEARADKISSARKLLKNFQQKKSSAARNSATSPRPEYTFLTEPTVPPMPGNSNMGTEVRSDEPRSTSQPAEPPSSRDIMAPAALPMFTFPMDSNASFSEYLGGGGGVTSPPVAGPSPSPQAAHPEPSPSAAAAGLQPPPSPPPPPPPAPAAEPPPPLPAAPVAEPPPPAPADAASAPPPPPGSDSPPTAEAGSMTSSFTFASQGGTGSHSATSSRHSDWEYVGPQEPEPARPQVEDPSGGVNLPAHLTSETLRQLSDRLSQMTSDDDVSGAPAAAAHALEERNAELAASLESERRLRVVAEQHLEDMRSRIGELETELESARQASERRLRQEQERLAEQAQAQAQTIGILVAEKTELKSGMERLQAQLADKTAECEQLSSRLAAAEASVVQLQEQTSRAGDMEGSVQHLQSLYAQADNERNRNRELCSELQEELDEARQRLRAQLDANQLLTRQLTDTRSRLELAEIRLTQLSGGQPAAPAADEQRQRAEQAERRAEQLQAERDAAAVQFQQYSADLAARLAEAEAARDAAAARLAERPPPAAAPETPPPPAPVPAVTQAEREELARLRQAAQQSADEVATLRRELRALSEENTRLTAAAQQQAAALHDMEVTVERANSSAVDSGQLAREMESDRVAASRAMAQNKQLKQQLQELQDGFIVLSNKKLELTEALEREQQATAERSRQLEQVQAELEQCSARLLEANHRNMASQQVIDQLRHYEAVGRQAETLQAELAAAEEKLAQFQSGTPAGAQPEDDSVAEERPASSLERPASPPERPASPPERAASPSGRPRPQLEDVIREREELRARLQQFIGGGAVDPAEHEKLRSALAQLEVRFCDVMNQLATLREERQGLEHLCEQLQGETDTIGEYISLYQVQRSALKQQALERQQELNTLHEDRQQLRQQLHQLQQLVAQLMSDRQTPAGGPPPPPPPPAAQDEPADSGPPSPAEPAEPAREHTARRIINLIEQIGANEYVDGHAAPLHVCQHCRGKRVLNV